MRILIQIQTRNSSLCCQDLQNVLSISEPSLPIKQEITSHPFRDLFDQDQRIRYDHDVQTEAVEFGKAD